MAGGLVRDGRQVWIGRWSEETMTVEHCHTVKLPPKAKAANPGLVLVDDFAFIGGVTERSTLFGMVDLTAESPGFKSLVEGLPPRLQKQPKPIDALVTDGEKLYLVDNRVVPKYLLTYDITRPSVPRFGRMLEMPVHGTGEHYSGAAVGGGHLVLLSDTMGRHGYCQHVAVLDSRTLVERGVVNLFTTDFSGEDKPTARRLTSARLWGDRLLLHNDENCLGVVDLEAALAPRTPDAGPEELYSDWSSAPELDPPRFERVDVLGDRELAELLVLPRSNSLVAIATDGSAEQVHLPE